MREILEYDEPIHQIRQWEQELLGYHFQIFQRPARMMRDVDGLSSRFDDPLLASYFTTTDALALSDATKRPVAYDPATFKSHNPLKCPPHMTPPPSTDIHASSFPLLLAPESATAVFPDRAVLANLPLRYQPTAHAAAGNPPTTTCHPVAPSPSFVCNGSHFLLMNHTLAWFSLTPQFGAIPSALADHSELFPLASLIFQPPLLPATLCAALVSRLPISRPAPSQLYCETLFCYGPLLPPLPLPLHLIIHCSGSLIATRVSLVLTAAAPTTRFPLSYSGCKPPSRSSLCLPPTFTCPLFSSSFLFRAIWTVALNYLRQSLHGALPLGDFSMGPPLLPSTAMPFTDTAGCVLAYGLWVYFLLPSLAYLILLRCIVHMAAMLTLL
jgi:hypothetical protein